MSIILFIEFITENMKCVSYLFGYSNEEVSFQNFINLLNNCIIQF